MTLTFNKQNDCEYNVHYTTNNKLIGQLTKDVDGFFYFFPDKQSHGCWDEKVLQALADKLRKLNADWGYQVKISLK